MRTEVTSKSAASGKEQSLISKFSKRSASNGNELEIPYKGWVQEYKLFTQAL